MEKHLSLSASSPLPYRVLDHPNLCKFVGASLKVPNVAIITEYCPKGSLNDVLLNDDIPLNWSFRFSFVADIARAMSYLHTHRVYHGRLKSSNCIIDDRWVVKVTGQPGHVSLSTCYPTAPRVLPTGGV